MRTNKQLVLIFGGSGFIGTHLVEELIKNNYEIVIADINRPKYQSAAEFQFCDVREEIMLDLPKLPNLIINLAAVHRTPGHAETEYFDTNINGALNITAWCNLKEIKHIFFVSSIAVYGSGNEIKTEHSHPTPESAYGRSKLIAEKIHELWFEKDPYERNLYICRPAVIFGKGERGNFTRLANALRKNRFVYPGINTTIKASGYVKDLVRSILFVIKHGENYELYNFAFPLKYTLNDVCVAFSDVSNFRKPLSLPINKFIDLLNHVPGPAKNLGIRIQKLRQQTIVEPQRLKEMEFNWEFDLKSAISDWNKSNSKEHFYE